MIPIALLTALLLPHDGLTVLRNVTLVDVEAANAADARRAGVTVILSGDEIQRVGELDDVPVPAGATVIDGTGKFLIPGLFDMHVHLGGRGDALMTSMVVHGVTSGRDLGGDLELLDAALERVARGELVGPRLARAGFVIEERGWLDRVLGMYDGNDPSGAEGDFMRRTRIGIRTEDDVLEAVGRVAESGAEVLKFRNTPSPGLFRFMMQEAQLAGLRIAGHEPNSIDLLEAVSLGMRSMEHTPINAILRGTSEERWQEIFAAMVEHGVHVTPTFVTMKGRRMNTDELEAALTAERQNPRWAMLPATLVDAWDAQIAERRSENSSLDWTDLFERGQAIVRGMHDAGVPFLAGTDVGVTFVYPGASMHDELVALVERAGLIPIEALRAATSNAAAWLGWKRLGTIREGHRADLVLLDADPLDDIANVGRIHTVFSRGVRYGPEERARLMGEMIGVSER